MTLLNVLLPFLFFEIYSILIAFIFVVIIETLIINQYLKIRFVDTFKVCFKANLWTTIIGYFLQGLLRFFIGLIIFLLTNKLNDNSFFQGFFGNVGITKQVYKDIDIKVLTTIFTSSVFALIISIFFEKRIFVKKFELQLDKTLITKSVIIANIVSYVFLTVWIYFNYQLQLDK
jgi:hypothetical protein